MTQDADAARLGFAGSGASPVDTIVLGAGVSGLVTASLLAGEAAGTVLVIDAYPVPGGNHISEQIGSFTFDVGSFVFDARSPFFTHFPELLPLCPQVDFSLAKLTSRGAITAYPISLRSDVIEAGPVGWARIGLSLGLSRLFRRRQDTALAFAENRLGRDFVRRSGLLGYMRRFYGVDPALIEGDFAKKRMTFIARNASLKGLLKLRKKSPGLAGPAPRVRPRAGFAALYATAQASLEARGVGFVLAQPIAAIDRGSDGRMSVRVGSSTYQAARLVSTIPINDALRLAGLAPEPRLATVSLITLYFRFSGRRGFREMVLYNFTDTGFWKRLTMHSDAYGRADDQEYFSVEVNADHAGDSVAAAEADFRRHMTEHGLFQGTLALVGSHVLDHAYPIYLNGATQAAEEAQARLSAFGILSFGRQGGFDYQPTASRSVVVATEALARDRSQRESPTF